MLKRFPAVLLAFGIIVSAFAILAPYIGAGAGEDFVLYRLAGLARRQVVIIGAQIAALAATWLFLARIWGDVWSYLRTLSLPKLHVDRLAHGG